ncbi:MAG: TetR/AcrR family transcriptional regulator [Planctomycetota bacterium]
MTAPAESPTSLAEAPSIEGRRGESRKQREIREREARILRVARDHLLEGGYLGLNMDRIAAEIEYSKGTIYQHFRNKEEILLALANEALLTRVRMFQAAADYDGPSRVRICTVGAAAEAFVEHFPHFFQVEQIVRVSSIWAKTSANRREFMEEHERRCMATTVKVVNDAIEAGELSLDDDQQPEEVIFGLWSMHFGAQIIAHTSHTLDEIGLSDPASSLRANLAHLLDGYSWQPLSTEFDYPAHMDQVKLERFRHEQFA